MSEEAADGQLKSDLFSDTDTRSALSEVVALIGAQGEAANYTRDLQPAVEEAPIVRLANTILQSAIKEKASDIHIEPDRRYVRVRFRIDGVLHEVMQMPGYIKAPLTARYKVLADVNLIQYHVPQQGQIATRYAGSRYNFRCSTLPTPFGEKVILHVSDSNVAKLPVNKLGFTPEMQKSIEDLLFWRRGMVLIASGNGQGKTTTQYVLLNRMNTVEVGIFAVAPDYEYDLPGITQARLNLRIGYTAETALASIAELDAGVVALDRCRSREATQLALGMAASGVLVLETLTASNAISALRYLTSSAERGLVTEGLSGILAQTLARRLCTQCLEWYEVKAQDLRHFGYDQNHPNLLVRIARGKGCEMCRNTGYRGRIGLFELVTMNDEIAAAIEGRAAQAQVEQVIRQTHPLTMRKDGLIKILQGLTTPEEVERAVPMLR